MNDFSSEDDADGTTQRCPCEMENVIIIGSEMQYRMFWLQNMFLCSGFALAQGRNPPPGYLRSVGRTSVLYVPTGYVRGELLALDWLRDNLSINIVRCASKADVLTHLRTRTVDGVEYKIRNLVVFSHGLPGKLALNYNASPRVDITGGDITGLPSDIFDPDGKIYSYACRTAVAPFAGSSLGQVMASHFNVTVRAYHRKTFYGDVVRDRADEPTIKSALRTGRAAHEGSLITLSPQYEAIPHPDLGSGVMGLWGGSAEGTNDYALWPTAGALALPVQHSTPASEPPGFATITP